MPKKSNGFESWLSKHTRSIRKVIRNPLVLEEEGNKKFALISDLHVGNEQCDKNAIREFCRNAIEHGINKFFVNGDYIEGKPHGIELSQTLLREVVSEQINTLKTHLPELEEGYYYFLNGNHEIKTADIVGKDWFKAKLLEDRDDFYYVGEWICRIEIDEMYVDLLHPQGMNNGCVDKYVNQYLAQISKHNPPIILDVGHFHERKYWKERNVPCFTNGAFLRKNDKKREAGWIVEIKNAYHDGKAEILIYEHV